MYLPCVILCTLVSSLCANCFAAESALPALTLKDSKVGDWVAFTTVAKSETGATSTSRIRQEIVAVSADKVTIQTISLKADDSANAISTSEVSREKSYGPLAGTTKADSGGEETLNVGTQRLACKWFQVKQRAGSESSITVLHTAPEVPVGGIVHIKVSTTDGQESVQALTAFGRGK